MPPISPCAARGATNATHPRHHLTPSLLSKPVSMLTVEELRHWRNGLSPTVMKATTVNRMCKAFKAALNLAAAHDDRITNAKAWTVGLAAIPEDDDTESNLVLTDEQRRDVVASRLCHLPGVRTLCRGSRRDRRADVQIAMLDVGDLHAGKEPQLMMPSSLKGKNRTHANPQAGAHHAQSGQAVEGRRQPDAVPLEPLLLMNPDGKRWSCGGASPAVRRGRAGRRPAGRRDDVLPAAHRDHARAAGWRAGSAGRVERSTLNVAMIERPTASSSPITATRRCGGRCSTSTRPADRATSSRWRGERRWPSHGQPCISPAPARLAAVARDIALASTRLAAVGTRPRTAFQSNRATSVASSFQYPPSADQFYAAAIEAASSTHHTRRARFWLGASTCRRNKSHVLLPYVLMDIHDLRVPLRKGRPHRTPTSIMKMSRNYNASSSPRTADTRQRLLITKLRETSKSADYLPSQKSRFNRANLSAHKSRRHTKTDLHTTLCETVVVRKPAALDKPTPTASRILPTHRISVQLSTSTLT